MSRLRVVPASPDSARFGGSCHVRDATECFVPIGFGHGFAVLSDEADVAYLLSSPYDPATESGIAWDDPDIGVE